MFLRVGLFIATNLAVLFVLNLILTTLGVNQPGSSTLPFLAIAGAVIILVAFLTNIAVSKFLNRPLLPACFLPLGNIIVFSIAVTTGIIIAVKGGITWRGTFYPKQILKKGRKLTFY